LFVLLKTTVQNTCAYVVLLLRSASYCSSCSGRTASFFFRYFKIQWKREESSLGRMTDVRLVRSRRSSRLMYRPSTQGGQTEEEKTACFRPGDES
jgi:hypothetical protein